MESLACVRSSVVSLSSSNSRPSCVVSLCENGLWGILDTRCNNNGVSICQPQGGKKTQLNREVYNEVLFADDQNYILTMAEGNLIELYDARRASASGLIGLADGREGSKVCAYQHSEGVAQFLAGTHPQGEPTTLFIDDNGAIVPIRICTLTPTETLPVSVFGGEHKISIDTQPSEERARFPSFGKLSNICCGLTRATSSTAMPCASKEETTVPLLVALGMDGNGALYSSSSASLSFQVSVDFESSKQVANPPLPTCLSAVRNRIAIGRADGSYTIADIHGKKEVIEKLTAPGHPMSGLCGVEWLGKRHPCDDSCCSQPLFEELEPLLTVSLTGDVTVWRAQEFLLGEEEEDADDDGLPTVCSAYSIRDAVGSPSSVTNCMCGMGERNVIFGDTLGNIIFCDVEIL